MTRVTHPDFATHHQIFMQVTSKFRSGSQNEGHFVPTPGHVSLLINLISFYNSNL